ncbi:MAG TPA: NAD-dependent epimerase/dehydratase family protein, partial [Candidatus Portnoybacteria bacterium]|nr:NAD-dependent epimerase/dehydratase family protein [Candidatus Portnoybacteria bacterium]
MTKKVLITGGCGFVGHHLVEGILKQTDWEIIILDKLSYASAGFDRLRDIEAYDDQRVKVLGCDLSNVISEGIAREIGQVNYIWHLAAESDVQRSLENSIPFVKSNVVGTAYFLEYVKKYQPNLEKFVTFSTDEVFGPAPQEVFYKEGDTCNPSNPYSGSKEGQEAISKSFAFSFGL